MNNMRNKILSLLVLLLTAATGAWADEVVIGEGTGNTHVTPTNSLWGFSFVEQIYTAAEIGMSGTITSIAFHQLENGDGDNPSVVAIYMKHVDKETFEGVADYSTVSASDKVWEGTLTYLDGGGWITFTLDTPFEYNGTDNLLIACHESTPGYSTRYFYCTDKENSVLSYHSDSYNPDINNLGSFGGNKYTNKSRADIKIDIEESSLDVTTNVEEGDTCFTEAWFNMPVSDATVEYELVRDMEYKVNAYVGTDAEVTYRHRVEKVSDNLYKPVNITDNAQIIALFNVIDTIDAASPKTLVYGTDFTVTIVDEDQNETVPAEFNFAPGIYTVKVTGIGDYDGLIDSRNQFKLYYGYELKVAPRNYATYYKDEPLTTADENAELYTIASINGSKAVLSEQMQSVPKNTPFLIYNNHQTDTVTFVLFPVEGGQLSLIQYAPEFKGTLNDSIMPASSEGTKYYICNGYDFVWVRNAGTIAANRCWLEISNSNARALNIVFDDLTEVKEVKEVIEVKDDSFYDLNGRKVATPKRKGVYIQNGRKVVVK